MPDENSNQTVTTFELLEQETLALNVENPLPGKYLRPALHGLPPLETPDDIRAWDDWQENLEQLRASNSPGVGKSIIPAKRAGRICAPCNARLTSC